MKKEILKIKKAAKRNLKTTKKSAKDAQVKEPKKEKVKIPPREISLSNLKAPTGAHKRRKYLGRGPSSGHGKTSTRGSKGQTSRAGSDFYLGFEGGQSPLIRKVPKRGFTSKFKKEYQIVNLVDLNRAKESTITPEVLQAQGLIKDKTKLVKILGKGEIKNSINIRAHAFSKHACEAIQKAGGKTELIPRPAYGGARD